MLMVAHIQGDSSFFIRIYIFFDRSECEVVKFQAEETPYFGLGPDLILNAIDQVGWQTTGKLVPLNSFENRVYQGRCLR
jgi:hypothetical protein